MAVSFISCDKKYTYIEIVKEKSLMGNTYTEKERDPEVIKAKNDSLAFAHAFNKFCISVYVNEAMRRVDGTRYSEPMSFKIIDGNDTDMMYSRLLKDSATIDDIFEILPMSEIRGVKLDRDEFKLIVLEKLMR